MLGQINEYTARLSAILQNSAPVITTALYYPYRTVGACGRWGREAERTFIDLGHMLEDAGVSFDIIDEALVRDAVLDGGALVYNGVRYDNIFVPDGVSMEDDAVVAKMRACGHEIVPVMQRGRRDIQGRRMLFADGTEGYFICSSAPETVSDEIRIESSKIPYAVDLSNGDLCEVTYSRDGRDLVLPVTLLRGEGLMLILTDEQTDVRPQTCEAAREPLSLTDAYISRRYSLDAQKGPQNTRYTAENGMHLSSLGTWDDAMSGEATYCFRVDALPAKAEGDRYVLDLGTVHHFARVYRNGALVGEATMPPYRLGLSDVQPGDEIRVIVANTTANVCRDDLFFDAVEPYYVGPYHANMKTAEAAAPAGGLIGPVCIAVYKEQ